MRKIVCLLLCLAFSLLLLASCDDQAVDPSQAESSAYTESSQVSGTKPWYETSRPEGYVSGGISADPGEASQPEEISRPEDASQPEDVSRPDDTGNEEGSIGVYEGNVFSRPASSCKIVFTKENPVVTLACATGFGVTAQYDGSVTRFFGAFNGEFYCAYPGKYLYPCSTCYCFVAGDYNSQNHQSTIKFHIPKEFTDEALTHEKVPHDGHGYGNTVRFYSVSEEKVYVYRHSEGGRSLDVYNNVGAVICRTYTHSGSVKEAWEAIDSEDGWLDLDEAKLGKYGVINNGALVIPFEYDAIRSYAWDSIGVFACYKDGRVYYISSNGANLTPEGYAAGSEPCENRAWVYEDDGQGYIIEFK